MLALQIHKRGEEPLESLRKEGKVPAVLYGPKEKSAPITVDERALAHVWKEAGESAIVTLQGVGADMDTLIHEMQFHPVTGRLLHADFYVLEKGKKVRLSIPLEFVGQAPAEKAGHILVKAQHEVEIEVEPRELPHRLDVDLSNLENVGDHITASEIPLPNSAKLITSADEIIVSITAFKEEKEEVTPAPETVILTAKSEAAEGEAAAVQSDKKGSTEA